MTPAESRPCLCGTCGRTFARSRSFPLCRAATALVYARIPLLPLPEGYADPRLARSNRVWSHEAVVVALLRNDLDTAQRLIDERADLRARRVLVGA